MSGGARALVGVDAPGFADVIIVSLREDGFLPAAS